MFRKNVTKLVRCSHCLLEAIQVDQALGSRRVASVLLREIAGINVLPAKTCKTLLKDSLIDHIATCDVSNGVRWETLQQICVSLL